MKNICMINDFTNLPRNNQKSYLGANGSKKCIIINGQDYMVKFPSPVTKTTSLSYANGCISEYIGCHIFEIAEIPVQETLLGTFTFDSGKSKVVVACKDMTKPGTELIPFAGLKNQIIDSPRNGYGTELKEILDTFENQEIFSQEELKVRFWDMFVIDALIGNSDRNNGNWGYLYDSLNKTVQLAPVYDCGSSLFPQADDDIMKSVLTDENELKHRVYSIPLSSIKIDDKRINYRNFINSLENDDCNQALKRIYPKLSIDKINQVIETTPYISDLQKSFYKTIISARKELILTYSYNQLLKREKERMNPTENITSKSYEDIGKIYIDAIRTFSKDNSVQESIKLANKKVLKSKKSTEGIINRKLLETYFNSKKIKNEADLSKYIDSCLKNKTSPDKSKSHPEKYEEIGR